MQISSLHLSERIWLNSIKKLNWDCRTKRYMYMYSTQSSWHSNFNLETFYLWTCFTGTVYVIALVYFIDCGITLVADPQFLRRIN